MQTILFMILTLLSHIGASLFFAKPRFNKFVTVVIWLSYCGVFLALPPELHYVSYFCSFALHMCLFFVTTVGKKVTEAQFCEGCVKQSGITQFASLFERTGTILFCIYRPIVSIQRNLSV